MSAPNEKTTSTVRQKDLELLAAAWETSKVAPQVDYDAIVARGFYSNTRSAQTNFLKMKKRLFGNDYKDAVATPGRDSGSPKKPATPRKRKGKAEPVVEDEGGVKGEDDGESPQKKSKQIAAKDEIEEDDEEVKDE